MIIRPSNVKLFARSNLPLVGLFKHSECEFAAAILVRICLKHGDEWAAHQPREFGLLMRDDIENSVEPWIKFWRNPFVFPDVRGLVSSGFAECDGKINDGAPVRFTQLGLAQLEKTTQ